MNIIIFTISYFLVAISVIGYGLLFKSFKNSQKKINFGYAGIFGIFILIIYSYMSSFFIAHNIVHNSIIIFLGTLFFFLKIKKVYTFNKKGLLLLFLTFSILYISALAYKTNEDFPYYHFSYTMLLTEKPSMLGIGVFNHGFKTPSSLFYINSLFFLPYIKFYSFFMAATLIMGFANLILLKKLINFIKKNDFNFIAYLSLLSFIFINIVFFRIAEHGTDRSAQVLILILVIELLILINFFYLNKYKNRFEKILVLTGIIISLKAFYILYFLFIIYLLFFLHNKINFFRIIKENILYFFLLTFLIILVLTINLKNSACFLYPVKFTCISSLPWSYTDQELLQMGIHYENWAKGGAGPGYKVKNPEIYIQNFNWLGNWMKVYFAEKGINTLAGIISITTIVTLTFYSKKKKISEPRIYKFVLLTIFFLLLEWFWKHPAFRYGGFCLWALLIFIPSSIFLEQFTIKILKTKLTVLLLITILIFVGRNFKRIFSEIEKYNYEPINYPYYHVNLDDKENYFSANKQIEKLIVEFENCENNNNLYSMQCISINKKIGKMYGKYFFSNKTF
jgi:hypothetical protein